MGHKTSDTSLAAIPAHFTPECFHPLFGGGYNAFFLCYSPVRYVSTLFVATSLCLDRELKGDQPCVKQALTTNKP